MTTPLFDRFGRSFQLRILHELIENHDFAMAVFDIIKKEYFSSHSLQWLLETIIKHVNEYRETPSYDAIALHIREFECEDVIREKIIEDFSTIKKIQFEKVSDKKMVCDRALEFCRSQNMKETLMECAGIMKQDFEDKIDKVFQKVSKAALAGTTPSLGINYLEDLDYMMDNTKRVCAPTGWDPIDVVLGGGLGMGELGVIMAPPNAGKTFLLCNIAAYNILHENNVVFYTMETTDTTVGVRIAAYISDYEINDIRTGDSEFKGKIKDIIKSKVTGNIIIKQYPARIPSANTFRAHLQLLELRGFVPDVIIIDYADLMKGFSGDSGAASYLFVKNLYEELKGLGQELKTRVWTATQVKTDAFQGDIITLGDAAEGSSKSHVADVMLSFSRKEEDKQQGSGRFYIAKGRDVEASVIFPAIVNLPKGKIVALERNSNHKFFQSVNDNTIQTKTRDKLRTILERNKT